MPLERAIAWGRAHVGEDRPSWPSAPGKIFFAPNALHDMTAYVLRDGAGSLGYFAGQRFRDEDSNEPWVLVDVVIPVVKQSRKTPMTLLLDATIEQARVRARAAGRQVVGWYHSAECSQPVLTRTDGAAHERHFAKSHSFMLMIALGRHERQAAVFRPSLERGPVLFYELLEPDASLGGEPATAVHWTNYLDVDSVRSEEPSRTSGSQGRAAEPPPAPRFTPGGDPRLNAPPTPAAATRSATRATPKPAGLSPSPSPPPPRARSSGFREAPADPAHPDSARREPADPAPEQPASWMPTFSVESLDARSEMPHATTGVGAGNPVGERRPPSRRVASSRASSMKPTVVVGKGHRRRFRWGPFLIGGLATAAVVAIVALVGNYSPALWSERQDAPRQTPAAGPLDLAANLGESEVARYQSTARLFDSGRVTCVDLGRVLVSVDEAWMSYSLERAAATELLDRAGRERERRLERDVVEVERHFRASECPRP